MSLRGSWLAQQAEKRPAHAALIASNGITSYSELESEVQDLASVLRGADVRPGDRVAVLMRNEPAFVRLIHALIEAEALLVPLNVRLTAGEFEPLLEDSTPRLLIHGDEFADLARTLLERRPSLRSVPAHALPALPKGAHRPLDRLRLERGQAIVFTSGTTGRPKGALLTLSNQLASATASAQRLGVEPEDRWLVSLPLYHVGGLAIVLRSAIYGTTVVLSERFDERGVARSLAEDRVTLVSLVPTMLARLLEVLPGGRVPETLRCVLLGGGPIPEPLLQRCRESGVPVAPTYGLTEAASQVATRPPGFSTEKAASAGAPLPDTAVRIVGSDGEEPPPGVAGEILVRGPQVMAGYWERPQETAEVLRDGWLRTGDLGFLDEDGDLFVLDRREDLIVSGGENVYPAEVESVLRAHPAVEDAAVIGVADPTWGQSVHAFIVRRPGSALTEEQILAHCCARLAPFKAPRDIRFVPVLPRTASGKLRRTDLYKSR